jgi:hypothetical protein
MATPDPPVGIARSGPARRWSPGGQDRGEGISAASSKSFTPPEAAVLVPPGAKFPVNIADGKD